MEKIREEAQAHGLLDVKSKTLYTRPCLATVRKMGYISEQAEVIEHYIRYVLKIEDFIHLSKGMGRNKKYVYLVPEASLYVELFDEVVGFQAKYDKNHVIKIEINSGKDEHFKKIANFINEIFPQGVIEGTNWEKVEKKFTILSL